MQPLKSGYSLSNWILRTALFIFIFLLFIESFKTLNFSKKDFYISSIFILSGIFLFIGGFSSKHTLTVVSGALLTVLSIYKIFMVFSGTLNIAIASYLLVLAIGFYFVCSGNQ